MFKKLKYLKFLHPRYIVLLSNRITHLEKELSRIKQLEKDFNDFVIKPDNVWLDKCKEERMDALIDDDNYTKPERREFHIDRYKFASNYVKNKVVADIACGTGYGTRVVLEDGDALKCVGVDIDYKAVLYAKRKHAVKGSEFICSSAENVPLEAESFDVIVSFETLEHVHDETFLISEFYRLLKSNGLLIISTPNEWPLSIAKYHTKEYDLEEFEKVLKTNFEIQKMYNQNSGDSGRKYNHSQPKGIIETTTKNKELAECYIAVCKKS